MDTVIEKLINIIFYPVSSRTFFLVLPCMMCFVTALWSLIGRMVKGRF